MAKSKKNKENIIIKDDKNKLQYKVHVVSTSQPFKNLLKLFSDSKNAESKVEQDVDYSDLNGSYIYPPYDLKKLAELIEYNTELEPCISSMVTNISGLGYRISQRVEKDKKVEQVNQAKSFLENCCGEDTFDIFRQKIRKDRELIGFGAFEVIFGSSNEITGFNHIPAWQVRMTTYSDPVEVEYEDVVEYLDEENNEQIEIIRNKTKQKFRRYCQVDSAGTPLVWFKAFGDPRNYNSETGEVETAEKPVPLIKRANALKVISGYNSLSAYSLPRYIGALINIYGSRLRDEICYTTLGNNNIPSIIVSVTDGEINQASIDRLKKFWDQQVAGQNYSSVIVIEATSLTGEANTKLDVTPLTKNQHSDSIWKDYDKENQDKIRRCFKLPPIYVGRADDYSKATAEVSRKLAEEQVFQPERAVESKIFNKLLIYNKMYDVVFIPNTPTPTDVQSLSEIMLACEKTGGITPRISRDILSEVLGKKLSDMVGVELDKPMTLQFAEAQKYESNTSKTDEEADEYSEEINKMFPKKEDKINE